MGLKCALRFPFLVGMGALLLQTGCSGTAKSTPTQVQVKVAPKPSLTWTDLPADQVKWRLGYGTLRAPKGGPVLEWSASSAELAFEGTGVRVDVRDMGDSKWNECTGNVLEIVVDGKDTIDHVIDPEQPMFQLEDLSHGYHRLRISKRTEALCGRTALGAVSIKGRMLPPPADPQHRILFVGGSVTCGWGVMDNDPETAFRPGSQSGTATYAAEASRRLDADFASVCISGRGLLWNWDRKTNGRIPEVWKSGTLNKDGSAVANEPAPDAVVLELGMLELQGRTPDQASFVRAYVDFVMEIHRRWPNAWIVGLDAPALDEEQLATLRSFLIPVDQWVKGRYKVKNFSRLFLTQQGSLGYGGGGHPNRLQSIMNGEELANHLHGHLGWRVAAGK